MKSVGRVITLSDPLEILREDHTKGLEKLEKITEAAKSIQTEGFTATAFQQISDSVRFIGAEMRKHHELEERYLFPLLDKHLFESPNIIRHERREMWQMFHELLVVIKDVEDGRIHGTTIRELVQSAFNVVERFKNHIDRENNIIFPMVKLLLASEEYERLRECIVSPVKSIQ